MRATLCMSITDEAVQFQFREFWKAVSFVQFRLNILLLHPDDTLCKQQYIGAYLIQDPPAWVNHMQERIADTAEDGLLTKLEKVVGNDYGKLENPIPCAR
ncbi:hypothetical protein BV898_16831 [Hypsibius exemplaris]|uniref:Uncharacterized protein n=1 Tax=Hypsibius exemplaris TaxID=2072580 RepID=A0A9X6NL83_HYPEX|nr:hypothetical protein BV898_16831 [Hypsibius exemplaris]